jgi:hypothetical protein
MRRHIPSGIKTRLRQPEVLAIRRMAMRKALHVAIGVTVSVLIVRALSFLSSVLVAVKDL